MYGSMEVKNISLHVSKSLIFLIYLFTFVQEPQGWDPRPFSLSKEQIITIATYKDFNMFVAVSNNMNE